MMSIECPHCGHKLKVFPAGGACSRCGKIGPYVQNNPVCNTWCLQCFRDYNNAHYHKILDKRKAEAANEKETWLKLLNSIPRDYPTLTDAQWLEACSYFGGCAFCGSEHVDARALFILRGDGGLYISGNVVPACEVCATDEHLRVHVFKHAKHALHHAVQITPERMERIKAFLIPRLEEASKWKKG